MNKGNFTPISLHKEMQRSYLEYAMSVIVGRALPDARDGLKPVQRRILFAMHELGLTPDRPFRKCARVVGDVLGKYHPHGDQAVYDALVRLVQDFSTRYPILEGHGNFGSVDDDPPAAMRYTETRLARITHQTLLKEIDSDTVTYSDNFDGSQKEPDVLPAQLPFLLLNGSSGIAVGMATNIPPHNLGEIINALIALIKDPEINTAKLNKIISGPDFPTGGEIIYSENIKEVYEKGRGSITVRGIIRSEEINYGKGKHKKNALVITELPYQISKAGWIEKLADLVNNNKINGISDIRDESDREGMRIIVELKRDVNQDLVISDLYTKTALQTNFGAIFLALINGKPVQLSLKEYLSHFLEYREETIKKRTRFHLRLAKEKLEVLEGFSLAVNNIKIIIETVQNSENSNEAKNKLIKNLKLSEKQSEAVLGMPIKKLTNLERLQIEDNIKELRSKKEKLNLILENRSILLNNLIEELNSIKNNFNTKRKTKIIKSLNPENQIETINKQILNEFVSKKVKLSIDNRFYLKKIIAANYKKAIENSNRSNISKNNFQFICNITKKLIIIAVSKHGKVMQINWEKSINNDCKLDKKLLGNINPTEIINFHCFDEDKENYLCLICEDGRFKKIHIDKDMIKTNRVFSIIKIRNESYLKDSFISDGNNLLVILTSIGRLLKFDMSNRFISPISKQAQGTIITKLFPQEKIISCCKSNPNKNLIIATKKGIFYTIKTNEISDSHCYKLGYLNEKIKLKKDEFLKISSENVFGEIETNKERSFRLNFSNIIENKKNYLCDTNFLKFEDNEEITSIHCNENLLS